MSPSLLRSPCALASALSLAAFCAPSVADTAAAEGESRADEVLSDLLHTVPPPARRGIARAIESRRAARERARAEPEDDAAPGNEAAPRERRGPPDFVRPGGPPDFGNGPPGRR